MVSTLNSLNKIMNSFENTGLMPVLFMGHGSPMNGIEDNEFSHYWKLLGKQIPLPKAVLCISAHWLTKGTFVTAMPDPKTIHDFGGFPHELYDIQYPAPGDPELARETTTIIRKTPVGLDHEWGLDHGTWTVVRRMFPEATVPVLQLSVDYYRPAQYHYDLASDLIALRKKGVLIIGSGNMVHNLRRVAWDRINDPGFGFDWAVEMNDIFKKNILEKNHSALINYKDLGEAAQMAVPTPDHYFPLLYTLALQQRDESPDFFNDKTVGGSLTMTSVIIS